MYINYYLFTLYMRKPNNKNIWCQLTYNIKYLAFYLLIANNNDTYTDNNNQTKTILL